MKMPKDTRGDGRPDLAIAGTFALVALAAAAIGAFAPLWAALVIGLAAAWIGEVFDHHLAAPVPIWRIFALAGTLGAAVGWLTVAIFWHRHDPAAWTATSTVAVAAAIATLALLCRPRQT